MLLILRSSSNPTKKIIESKITSNKCSKCFVDSVGSAATMQRIKVSLNSFQTIVAFSVRVDSKRAPWVFTKVWQPFREATKGNGSCNKRKVVVHQVMKLTFEFSYVTAGMSPFLRLNRGNPLTDWQVKYAAILVNVIPSPLGSSMHHHIVLRRVEFTCGMQRANKNWRWQVTSIYRGDDAENEPKTVDGPDWPGLYHVITVPSIGAKLLLFTS